MLIAAPIQSSLSLPLRKAPSDARTSATTPAGRTSRSGPCMAWRTTSGCLPRNSYPIKSPADTPFTDAVRWCSIPETDAGPTELSGRVARFNGSAR